MSYNYGANRRVANSASARNCANPNQGSISYPYSQMNGGNNSYPPPYMTSSVPNNSMRHQQPSMRRCGGRSQMRTQSMMQNYPSQETMNNMRSKVMTQYSSTCPVAASPSSPAPNPFTPRPDAPIMVNVSAATLASAKNTPVVADRGECGMEGNPGVKYIPLSWNDILGKTGMNGMRVSMVPSNDPSNPNRQLKVSFGGQQGVNQAGETPLRVVSFQPVNASAGGSAGGAPPAPMNFSLTGSGGGSGGSSSYGNSGSSAAPTSSCNCPSCQRLY